MTPIPDSSYAKLTTATEAPGDGNPLNVWKQFCRKIESKEIVRNFGNMVPMIDQCALFEFTDEQIHNAQMHVPEDLTEDEHYPIPPFPFPSMCMVGSGGVIVLHSPLMNEETSILEFETMTYQTYDRGASFFQKATCVVNTTRLDDDGRFPMKLRNPSGMLGDKFWSNDSPIYTNRSDEELLELEEIQKHKKHIAGVEDTLEKARTLGDLKKIAKLEKAKDEYIKVVERRIDLVGRTKTAEARLEKVENEARELQIDGLTDAFYLGLQEVNWINHPDHYTIEVNANPPLDHKKKKKKASRIRRLHERPSHIILSKDDIVSKWRTAHQGGTHAPPIPHLRRGHYKTLRAERYKEKRGQRIWVRASHVGGECVEWRDGAVRYKVL